MSLGKQKERNRAGIQRQEEEGKLSSLIHPLADLRSNTARHRLTQAIKMKPWRIQQLVMVSGYLARIYHQRIADQMSTTLLSIPFFIYLILHKD